MLPQRRERDGVFGSVARVSRRRVRGPNAARSRGMVAPRIIDAYPSLVSAA
jgi:hypothetical protein